MFLIDVAVFGNATLLRTIQISLTFSAANSGLLFVFAFGRRIRLMDVRFSAGVVFGTAVLGGDTSSVTGV